MIAKKASPAHTWAGDTSQEHRNRGFVCSSQTVSVRSLDQLCGPLPGPLGL